MSNGSPAGNALFEQLLRQEQEDDVVCNFGYDYFNGVRWGAGAGCAFSFFASMRLSWDLQAAMRIMDARHPPSVYDRSVNIVSRGFRSHPFITTGMVCFFVTGWTKLYKWYSASIRVNNFALASFDYSELRKSMASDAEAVKLFDRYSAELDKPEATLLRIPKAVRDPPPVPTFGDGVAVGLYGSLFDAWLPTKPTRDYMGYAAGRKLY